jgi:hypothetical protein
MYLQIFEASKTCGYNTTYEIWYSFWCLLVIPIFFGGIYRPAIGVDGFFVPGIMQASPGVNFVPIPLNVSLLLGSVYPLPRFLRLLEFVLKT